MNQEDKELLWRYRYALFKENKALTKLLICVDWSDEHEVCLMPMYEHSFISYLTYSLICLHAIAAVRQCPPET